MQYAFTSLRPVIAQVIRNMRLLDPTYIADMHEWLYEAMGMMETHQALQGMFTDLDVQFHKAKLPCGLRYIDGVQYRGARLREGGGTRPASKDSKILYNNNQPTVFSTSIAQVETVENHITYETTLTAVNDLCWNERDYYYTELGVLNTSFADGTVTLYYRAVPSDEDGLPLIPDNANYRQALYWYCRSMIIGAGYEDKYFTADDCLQKFEQLYAPRAIAEIRLPSPEQMERRVRTLTRFIPPAGYYDNFFSTDRPEGFYDPKG